MTPATLEAPSCNVSETCAALVELQAHRVATIRAQLRLNNAAGALARRALGWQFGLPKAESDRIKKEARELVAAVEEGHSNYDTHLAHAASAAAPFISAIAASRESLDLYRESLEKRIKALAMTLPVYEWVKGVKGFGAPGLGVIVGECGDLSSYANPGKLWKRAGLAPPDCYAMECKDGRTARAIPKRRRSAFWTLGDSMVKVGDEGEGGYRKVYLDRKAYEVEQAGVRGLTVLPAAKINAKNKATTISQGHVHRRAQRYMEKRLLKDLWIAWKAVGLT